MDCISGRVYKSLDKNCSISIYYRYPDIVLYCDKVKRAVTSIEMDRLFGIRHLDFIHNKHLLDFYRNRCCDFYKALPIGIRPADKYATMVYAKVITKLGFGECGESSQMFRYKFCKDSGMDGVQMSLSLYQSANRKINHALSLFIPRENVSKISMFEQLLEKRLNILTLKDVVGLFPDAFLTDIFFREADLLVNFSRCKSLFKYICMVDLNSIRIIDSQDSNDDDLRATVAKTKVCAGLILGKITAISREEFRITPELSLTYDLYRLRADNFEVNVFRKLMPTISWHKSGSCLVMVDSLRVTNQVIQFLNDFDHEGNKFEFFECESSRFPGKKFLIVNLNLW